MDTAKDTRVCVIGAGIAGLVTAKVLAEDGFDVTVIEKGATLGGVWADSRTYPGLRANNPTQTYAFSDHPFPPSADDYPSASQMREYLTSYARRFRVDARIRFNTEVVGVEPLVAAAGEPERWRVSMRGKDSGGSVQTLDFDRVVICNGVFSRPRLPTIEGAERFAGQVRHSSDLTEPNLGAGKRIVVVGGSKSALDCAVWAARESGSCTLVLRNAYWMWPRYIFGLLNPQWLMFSRMTAALIGYYRLNGAETRLHTYGRWFIWAAWRLVTRVLRAHARGAGALVPDFKLPEHIESMGVGGEAYDLVRAGKILPRRGEIRRFTGGTGVELASGDKLEADLVVFATGFSQEVPFLAETVSRSIQRADGFHLYRMILPPEHRTLAFNGYNSSTACQMTAEIAAHWISDCFQGRLSLPGVAAMDAEISERKAWLARVMPARSQGFFIGPCVIHYVDELLSDMGVATNRRSSPLAEQVLPTWPSNYRMVGEERRRRSGVRFVRDSRAPDQAPVLQCYSHHRAG